MGLREGKEQTPLMSMPGTSSLCLPGGVPPVLSLLPTFGESGTHSWGLKGCEAHVPMGTLDISTSPKREKPCSVPSH